MSRPPRVKFAGAIYHLMNRGVRGEDLYTDARERAHFLALLAQTRVRYEWLVGSYCLMGNHYHLLVTTPEPTLSVGMQWLNSCYAQWFTGDTATGATPSSAASTPSSSRPIHSSLRWRATSC